MALITEKMNDALNVQIGEELSSAYIYKSMAIWLKENAYNNLSAWFFAQEQEEILHADKFINYIIETGGSVKLPTIPEPKNDWKSVKEIVEITYAHEQHITKCIHDLVKLSEELHEVPIRSLLHWFVDEQVEEESNTGELVQRQARFNNDILFDTHTTRAAESSEE